MSRSKAPQKDDGLRIKQAASFDEAAFTETSWKGRRISPRSKLSTEVFNKARSTLNTIGDAWKGKPAPAAQTNETGNNKKGKTKKQTTLDYFLKPKRNDQKSKNENHVVEKLVLSPENFLVNNIPKSTTNGAPLKKLVPQASIDICTSSSLPIPNDVTTISRNRPATIATDRPKSVLDLPDLSGALTDRPRKKLSFREPEILGYSLQKNETLPRRKGNTGTLTNRELFRSVSEVLRSGDSYEDLDLENQAMRVVRTVGQAFEVCHKLSVEEAPSPEPTDLISNLQDEIDIEDNNLDLLPNNDRVSDKASDQTSIHKKDLLSEPVNNEIIDVNEISETTLQKSNKLEMLPPPPVTPGSKRSPLTSAEMYSSPLIEPLKTSSGSLPQPGSPLSPHHEVQLLREQLEQQTQQTQSVHLHNGHKSQTKAASVQSRERSSTLPASPREKAAVAQMQLLQDQLSAERAARMEAQNRTHQLLIHNRELLDHITALVSHLQDTERNNGQISSQNTSSQVPTHLTCVSQQRCDPGSPYMSDSSYLLSAPDSPMRKNNNNGSNIFAFNSYPQEQQLQTHLIKQYLEAYNNPVINSYSQNHYQYPTNQPFMFQNKQINNNNILQQPQMNKKKIPSSPLAIRQNYSTDIYAPPSSYPESYPDNIDPFTNQLAALANATNFQSSNDTKDKNKNIIKPLSQVSTLTTTDEEGRVRVIVPVASEEDDKVVESLVTLKITDEDGNKRVINGPPCITRSTSEKIPNRSELMSQVQRTMWARHTTK